jgi:hypothetical protein
MNCAKELIMRRISLSTIMLVSVLGCATAPHPPNPIGPDHARSWNVLTGEQIRSADRPNALAAISMMRPSFVRGSRGSGPPAVYVDGVFGNYSLSDLETISSESIVEIRFLSPVETLSLARYHSGGAIVVRTGRRWGE